MSTELMKSKFVRCPSVSQLSLYLMCGFLSNLSCWFPWAICSNWTFEKKNTHITILYDVWFVFSLIWDSMQATFFKLLLNFLSNGPQKVICLWNFWKFENWNFKELFFVLVNVGPSENRNFKTLLRTNRSQKFSNLSWIFLNSWNVEFAILTIVFP